MTKMSKYNSFHTIQIAHSSKILMWNTQHVFKKLNIRSKKNMKDSLVSERIPIQGPTKTHYDRCANKIFID